MMESVSSLYQKLIYRDILGYVIPGGVLVGAIWTVLTPIKVAAYEVKPPQSVSATELIIILALGFIVAHLIAFFPRKLAQKRKWRIESAQRAFSHDQIKVIEPWLNEAVTQIFSSHQFIRGAWEGLEPIDKREYIRRWVEALGLKTDQYHRIFAIRLFCENSMIILPLAMFMLALKVNIANLSRGVSACVLILLGILLGYLARLGWREIRVHEDREAITILVDFYIRQKVLQGGINQELPKQTPNLKME